MGSGMEGEGGWGVLTLKTLVSTGSECSLPAPPPPPARYTPAPVPPVVATIFSAPPPRRPHSSRTPHQQAGGCNNMRVVGSFGGRVGGFGGRVGGCMKRWCVVGGPSPGHSNMPSSSPPPSVTVPTLYAHKACSSSSSSSSPEYLCAHPRVSLPTLYAQVTRQAAVAAAAVCVAAWSWTLRAVPAAVSCAAAGFT